MKIFALLRTYVSPIIISNFVAFLILEFMSKENTQLFILVFLGTLAAFGPFVTDMYLPTLPAMAGYFHATSS